MPRVGGYQTKQKAQVLQYLETHSRQHITAAELLIALNTGGVQIGSATVYRQLEKLEEQGLVRRYSLDDRGSACWQFAGEGAQSACHSHFHLKCTVCGRLIHLDCGHLQQIANHVAEEHGFQINPARTVFYGTCGDCSGAESISAHAENPCSHADAHCTANSEGEPTNHA